MKKKESDIKKNFFWNTIGTSLNAFNSLFFMIIVTRINGVDEAGIFTFAFSTACLFYVIGIYSGRAYQVTENNNNISDSDYFYTKSLTCLLMICFAIIYCLISQYNIYKFTIILFLILYKVLESFSEFTYAVIQKDNKLYKVGKSLFYKSLFSLLLFLVVDIISKNLIISEISIFLVNIIIIVIYDIPNLKKSNFKMQKVNLSKILNLLKNGFCTFAFTFLTMYVINASKYSIDDILENKYQTIFGIILMPATILSLFAQFIIQPFVLRLKNSLEDDYKKFKKLVLKLTISVFVIGVITIVIAYPFGIPLLNLLYGLNLEQYLLDFIVIMIGAVFYSSTMVISTALTTMRYTFNQLIIFLITSIVAMFLSNYLILEKSLYGASLAYTISMLLLFVLYLIAYYVSAKKHMRRNKNE